MAISITVHFHAPCFPVIDVHCDTAKYTISFRYNNSDSQGNFIPGSTTTTKPETYWCRLPQFDSTHCKNRLKPALCDFISQNDLRYGQTITVVATDSDGNVAEVSYTLPRDCICPGNQGKNPNRFAITNS